MIPQRPYFKLVNYSDGVRIIHIESGASLEVSRAEVSWDYAGYCYTKLELPPESIVVEYEDAPAPTPLPANDTIGTQDQ